MKSCCSILVLILFGLGAFAQGSDWQKSTQWTIYSVHGRSFWQLPVDSLSLFHHRDLNSDSMKLFLAGTKVLAAGKVPVWMGGFVTSCMFADRKRKLLISSYGGFFYDDQEKRYYQIPPDRQKQWLDYLADAAAGVSSN